MTLTPLFYRDIHGDAEYISLSRYATFLKPLKNFISDVDHGMQFEEPRV